MISFFWASKIWSCFKNKHGKKQNDFKYIIWAFPQKFLPIPNTFWQISTRLPPLTTTHPIWWPHWIVTSLLTPYYPYYTRPLLSPIHRFLFRSGFTFIKEILQIPQFIVQQILYCAHHLSVAKCAGFYSLIFFICLVNSITSILYIIYCDCLCWEGFVLKTCAPGRGFRIVKKVNNI